MTILILSASVDTCCAFAQSCHEWCLLLDHSSITAAPECIYQRHKNVDMSFTSSVHDHHGALAASPSKLVNNHFLQISAPTLFNRYEAEQPVRARLCSNHGLLQFLANDG